MHDKRRCIDKLQVLKYVESRRNLYTVHPVKRTVYPAVTGSALFVTCRFLLYDVNPGEGFNLRRDVYMRVANLVHLMNQAEPWVLVLPPWVKMWHWRSRDVAQDRLKWADFFDVDSMGKHVPVIELEDYIQSKVKYYHKQNYFYLLYILCHR